ncbi:HNH endonuclease [Clavibacter phage CN1A]|uniref:HNH endonuclease n=1 Tax=Clavibacter phage CN1A TaxID=1406793 RepID=U5PXJ9_9CAUD|nr:HNH endonuclease [Clavibacter phage CN1A]AGY47183.1 HNH endonuclease [Clavibacter phage CN1A]
MSKIGRKTRHMLGRPPIPLKDRFWAKVTKTDTCWLWTASKNSKGYGRIKVGKRYVAAHRVAYQMEVGPIPEGLQLDHVKARGYVNRHCVKPAHLEPVTARVNIARGNGIASQNARKTHCLRDHEFTKENTYLIGTRRQCKTCARLRASKKEAPK